jgi:hypothetical protein
MLQFKFLKFVVILCLSKLIELPQTAGDLSNGTQYEIGSNVLAAISHYTEQVRRSPSNPEFIRHLTTALRFAGRFEECAAVCFHLSKTMQCRASSLHSLRATTLTIGLI